MIFSVLNRPTAIHAQPETAPKNNSQEDRALTGDSVSSEQILKWVSELDADSLAVRRQASQRLIDLGPGLLRDLPPNRSTDSPERSEALIRIRRDLEVQLAEQMKRPSRVSLNGEMTLWEALQSIEEQTQNGFDKLNTETEPQVLDLEDVTYWDAISELLRKFPQFRLHPFRSLPGKLQLMLVPPDFSTTPPLHAGGVFLFEPMRVESTSDLTNPMLDTTAVMIRMRWEPRLRPLSIVHDLTRLQGTTDLEHVLKSDRGQERLETPVQSGMGWVDFRATLQKADRSDQWVEELQGSLRVTLPAVETSFQFKDLKLEQPIEQRTGKTVVTLMGTRKVNQLQSIQLRIRFDESSGSLESHRQWLFESPAILIDPDGNPVEYFTFETTLQKSDEVGISYLFGIDGDLADHVFEYRAPSAILTIEQDWAIQKLELP
ncbi:MAG: hypothetical protein VXZ54_02450 [Planctomycetota bacterium]|nr:hypothetical protein [Planctomycetota bacterium]